MRRGLCAAFLVVEGRGAVVGGDGVVFEAGGDRPAVFAVGAGEFGGAVAVSIAPCVPAVDCERAFGEGTWGRGGGDDGEGEEEEGGEGSHCS